MPILYFSDILKKAGLDPAKVKLIRHSLSDDGFQRCYHAEPQMVWEYTRVQKPDFSKGYTYWCVFISGKSTTARFFACYRVSGWVPDAPELRPVGFPIEVVENEAGDYALWQAALSAVNAVYLIVDTQSGRQYVGSAYGKEGLLGRWRIYVDSLHGHNKLMKELICAHPERYKYFQFSILQILPKTVTDDEVIHTESLWKQKLRTIEFGMNDN